MMIDDKDKIYSTFLSIVSFENYFLKNDFSVLCINYRTLTELETFVLDTHNSDRLISIFTEGTFNLSINT